jgi:hypothetical protein
MSGAAKPITLGIWLREAKSAPRLELFVGTSLKDNGTCVHNVNAIGIKREGTAHPTREAVCNFIREKHLGDVAANFRLVIEDHFEPAKAPGICAIL